MYSRYMFLFSRYLINHQVYENENPWFGTNSWRLVSRTLHPKIITNKFLYAGQDRAVGWFMQGCSKCSQWPICPGCRSECRIPSAGFQLLQFLSKKNSGLKFFFLTLNYLLSSSYYCYFFFISDWRASEEHGSGCYWWCEEHTWSWWQQH